MEATVRGESRIAMIPIYKIYERREHSVRRYSREDISPLSKSIERNGILQPVTVRFVSPYRYELVSGERRVRAAVMAGLTEIPCIILHCSEMHSDIYGLVENLQRSSPDCFERAKAINTLIQSYGFTRDDVSAQLGITRSAVEKYLSILCFDRSEIKIIKERSLTFDHIAALSHIKVKSVRRKVLITTVKEELTPKETAQLVKSITEGRREDHPIRRMVFKDMRIFSNTIERAVDMIRSAGIKAEQECTETDDRIEYRVTIIK